MIDAVYINASLTKEDAEKKRLTYKSPDEFGLFLVHHDADNQLYAVLPKHTIKVICEIQSIDSDTCRFLRLAKKAGFKVKDGEILDGDGYHIQTDEVKKFYDLVRRSEWVELDEREKYAIASFHLFNESIFQAIYEDISAKLKEKNGIGDKT